MLSARFSFPVTAACPLLWLMLENLCRHRKERDTVQLKALTNLIRLAIAQQLWLYIFRKGP